MTALRSFHEQKRIESDQMHHTGLDRGVTASMASAKPVSPSQQTTSTSVTPRFLVGDDAQPEFGAFVSLAQPQTQHVFARHRRPWRYRRAGSPPHDRYGR